MTDIDRLQFHFPEEVQARIEDLDRRIEGARAEEEDHQRALSRLQNDLAQSLALRKAVFETAEIFLRNAPDLRKTVFDPNWIERSLEALGPDSPRPITQNERKRRRDIRGEALTAVRITGPTTVAAIVAGLHCQRKQVEAALAYHGRAGRVVEGPEGVWRAAPAETPNWAAANIEPALPSASNGQQTHPLPDYRHAAPHEVREEPAEDEA